MSAELFDRLEALRELTEAQLHAARQLDGLRLVALNERREELLFDLQLLLDEQAADKAHDAPRVRALCREIRALEERLLNVSRTVLAVIGTSMGSDTYDRQGRFGLAG